MADLRKIPKADMHVHLEGTITPAMVRRLSEKNGVPVPATLMNAGGDGYQWRDEGSARERLISFVNAYDDACRVMKTAQDYTDITHDYLTSVAVEGCIYAEIAISADHGAALGLSYPQMIEAIEAGYLKARAETGIEARLISTCVRHYGVLACLKAGQMTAAHPHPLVTAFGMAGDENAGTVADFLPAYQAAGLINRTAHAGEAAGPDSVRQARDILGIRRFGHMVRAIEDSALMEELAAIKAVPEVCVASNLALRVFESYAQHPLKAFFDRGLKVTLGSDDPSFFRTTIGREYQLVHDHFGLTAEDLLQVTRNAVTEAFVDAETRDKLLKKLTI